MSHLRMSTSHKPHPTISTSPPPPPPTHPHRTGSSSTSKSAVAASGVNHTPLFSPHAPGSGSPRLSAPQTHNQQRKPTPHPRSHSPPPLAHADPTPQSPLQKFEEDVQSLGRQVDAFRDERMRWRGVVGGRDGQKPRQEGRWDDEREAGNGNGANPMAMDASTSTVRPAPTRPSSSSSSMATAHRAASVAAERASSHSAAAIHRPSSTPAIDRAHRSSSWPSSGTATTTTKSPSATANVPRPSSWPSSTVVPISASHASESAPRPSLSLAATAHGPPSATSVAARRPSSSSSSATGARPSSKSSATVPRPSSSSSATARSSSEMGLASDQQSVPAVSQFREDSREQERRQRAGAAAVVDSGLIEDVKVLKGLVQTLRERERRDVRGDAAERRRDKQKLVSVPFSFFFVVPRVSLVWLRLQFRSTCLHLAKVL
ncbi:hypothetical protein FA15DRAFT_123195 [Coprinopsis marcescibilis]|uniref:Uncharacterized protein n=1 Tax=Coprinopsis marcescibilis TaxID=230819 RepID=A0A5C3KK60_COPMA|nr:hypothetical protein FA15DRAFT_123195 [Coprinopsis marcescibilis]